MKFLEGVGFVTKNSLLDVVVDVHSDF